MDRINIVKKYTKKENIGKKPSNKELEEAYGYLNNCMYCGKEIKRFEPINHCMLGNYHKFGCSKMQRLFGRILKILMIIFFPITILCYLLVFIWYRIEELFI
jgi:hypothetical protein